jgi:hypothetical protein
MSIDAPERREPTVRSSAKITNIAFWIVQVLLAATFLGSAAGKLLGRPEMVALFEKIDVGQ